MSETKPQHEDNWSAAGMAGMFDAVHRQRDRRRYRRMVALCVLTTVIFLGLPLWTTWNLYQDARRNTLLEEYAVQSQKAEQLPEGNPAVAAALGDARKWRQMAGSETAADAIPLLRKAIAALQVAGAADRDMTRLRDLLNPLGETLSGEQWNVSSAGINARLQQLSQQHKQIVSRLDRGEIDTAQKELAELLQRVGTLQRDNVEAMQTSLARQAWVRLQSVLPNRLQTDSTWQDIQTVGQQAEDGWKAATDWVGTRTLFAQATQRAEKFLEQQLTAEEKAKYLQADSEAIARMETEKADLRIQIDQLNAANDKVNQDLAAVISERQTLMADAVRLRQENADQKTELTKLRPLEKQVATLTEERDTARAAAATAAENNTQLAIAKQQAESQLKQSELKVATLQTRVDTMREGGAVDTVSSQVAAAMAAIETQLLEVGQAPNSPAKLQVAQEAMVAALQQYDDAVAERDQARAEKFLETSDRMQDCNKAITLAEAGLQAALTVLDEASSAEYSRLQQIIDTASAELEQLLTQVAPDNVDAQKLTQRITRLNSDRDRYQAAWQRHSGDASPQGRSLVAICRQSVQELLEARRRSEFEKLVEAGQGLKLAGQDFVAIPAGEFLMGSTDGYDNEQPVHQVQITKPFFAGQHEVTVGQILTWLNSSGVEVDDNWIDFEESDCPIKKSGSRYVLNTSSKFGKSERQPMVEISWYGAKAYCAWASQQVSGFRIRLPTEAEWEYMCRAGATTTYPWGESIDKDDANYGGNVGATTEVGKYPANAFGLSDMIGNVYEWCEDVYDSDFYASSAATQPNPVNLDSSSGSSRVVRGGSWLYDNGVRSSDRSVDTPAYHDDFSIGFRVVAD